MFLWMYLKMILGVQHKSWVTAVSAGVFASQFPIHLNTAVFYNSIPRGMVRHLTLVTNGVSEVVSIHEILFDEYAVIVKPTFSDGPS